MRLGRLFHNLVVAGIKDLKYWVVLNLTEERERLLELSVCLVKLIGWNNSARSEYKGCEELWKMLYSIQSVLTERRWDEEIFNAEIKNLQHLCTTKILVQGIVLVSLESTIASTYS